MMATMLTDGTVVPDFLNLTGQFIPQLTSGLPAYPDGNPKTVIGSTKPNFDAIPNSSLIELGKAMDSGRKKYGLYNYRDRHVTASTYYNAALRHLLDYWDGRNFSDDTSPPVHHLGHVMACCAILLDATALKTLNDDRGPKGNFDQLIKDYSNHIKS